jgi:uncharacterized membrane protein (DUF2068 family)
VKWRNAARGDGDRGLRLIIAYKLTKGALQLLGAAVLGVLIATHVAVAELHHIAGFVRDHFTSAASEHVAALLTALEAPRRLVITAVALGLDGGLTTVEGAALHHRRWWGPWLVVVATGALLPFEAVHFLGHPRVGRALLLVVNLALVAYLARRALRERAEIAR